MTRIRNLERRAGLGDKDAAHALAVALATGDGVAADLRQARVWYERAARAGSCDAAFNLAVMLLNGEGGRAAKTKGQRWMHKASEMGSGDASVYLGECAVAASDVETACSYFVRAVIQGDLRGLREIASVLRVADAHGVALLADAIEQALGGDAA